MAHPRSPSPKDIRAARLKTGLTIDEAAYLVYCGRSKWVSWERDPKFASHRGMPPAYAELFALKVGLKELVLTPNRLTLAKAEVTENDNEG